MSTQHLDNKREAYEKINSIIYKLQSLSYNFFVTGNEKVSIKLDNLSNKLVEVKELYESAYDELFNEVFKQSQQNSANVFNAVLGGIQIANLNTEKSKKENDSTMIKKEEKI